MDGKVPAKYHPNMTAAMLDCLVDEGELRAEILKCHRAAHKAFAAADFSLPAKAADGKTPVFAGARSEIHELSMSYWVVRRDLAVRLLRTNGANGPWLESLGISSLVYNILGRLEGEAAE